VKEEKRKQNSDKIKELEKMDDWKGNEISTLIQENKKLDKEIASVKEKVKINTSKASDVIDKIRSL